MYNIIFLRMYIATSTVFYVYVRVFQVVYHSDCHINENMGCAWLHYPNSAVTLPLIVCWNVPLMTDGLCTTIISVNSRGGSYSMRAIKQCGSNLRNWVLAVSVCCTPMKCG